MFLQKCSNKREICFKEHSRIRLATICIYQIFYTLAHLDLIVDDIFPLWTRGLALQYIRSKYA
jgi:hypothetical protein